MACRRETRGPFGRLWFLPGRVGDEKDGVHAGIGAVGEADQCSEGSPLVCRAGVLMSRGRHGRDFKLCAWSGEAPSVALALLAELAGEIDRRAARSERWK